jgi:hypothetical protein
LVKKIVLYINGVKSPVRQEPVRNHSALPRACLGKSSSLATLLYVLHVRQLIKMALLFCFVSFRFVSFRFVSFCFVLFCQRRRELHDLVGIAPQLRGIIAAVLGFLLGVKKMPCSSHIYTKADHFTKTGSGQTQRKMTKGGVFCL